MRFVGKPCQKIIHHNHIAKKFNRVNSLLHIIKNFANRYVIRTTYFSIFDTHINDAFLKCWEWNGYPTKKVLRVMNFQPRVSHSSPYSNPSVL